MNFPFVPMIVADTVADLSPEFLRSKGIKLLMMDFDNTIVPYTTDIPSEQVAHWLQKMQHSDITICVVSNSRRSRVQDFCRERGIPCITHARKPFAKGIRQCLAQFACSPEQCALVGDQIYTDTLGANCAGVCSILVSAIDNHNIWLKLRHVAEMPFILAARNRRIRK